MITIADFKVIFNEKAILTPAEKAQEKLLKEFGAYTRTVAKNSMIDMNVGRDAKKIKKRDRKLKKQGFEVRTHEGFTEKVSKPGSPAFSKVGYVKQHIYFAADAKAKEVVIGPAKLSGVKSDRAVEVLEHGGVEQIFIGGPRQRISVTANYKARPTMHLAFEKALEKKLPKLIEGGIMREV